MNLWNFLISIKALIPGLNLCICSLVVLCIFGTFTGLPLPWVLPPSLGLPLYSGLPVSSLTTLFFTVLFCELFVFSAFEEN